MKDGSPVKSFKLKDGTASVRVSLWKDLASTAVKEGDLVSLKKFSISEFNRKTNINSIGNATVEVNIIGFCFFVPSFCAN